MGYPSDDVECAETYAEMVEEGAWSTPLLDCSIEPGGGALCCVSLLMPFVQYGILSEQLPKGATCFAGSFGCSAAAFLGLEVLAAVGGCMVLPGVSLLPLSALLHRGTRRHIRDKYGIKGSCCGDLCAAWWCGPCALAQETREVAIRAAAQRRACPASAAPTYLIGNLLLPPPAVAVAAAAANCAPATATASRMETPATGVPVVGGAPPTQVATVTLLTAK